MDRRTFRANIFHELQQDLKHGRVLPLDVLAAEQDATRVIGPKDALPAPRAPSRPPTVRVEEADCIDFARARAAAGERVLVLNMASDYVPGGGVRKGSLAQEEELCRRTTLYPALMAVRDRDDCYPLAPGTVIVSPRVTIVAKADPYEYESTWTTIAVVSSAAVRTREGDRGMAMDRRIERLLHVCSTVPHDVLVLSAWGCGAFRNDPAMVARAFRDVLSRVATGSSEVVFAIMGGGANLATFRAMLG